MAYDYLEKAITMERDGLKAASGLCFPVRVYILYVHPGSAIRDTPT